MPHTLFRTYKRHLRLIQLSNENYKEIYTTHMQDMPDKIDQNITFNKSKILQHQDAQESLLIEQPQHCHDTNMRGTHL